MTDFNWISVKDRTPEPNVAVLVIVNNPISNALRYDVCCYVNDYDSDKKAYGWKWRDSCGYRIQTVIFWSRLPQISNEWISVNNKVPNNNDSVLVALASTENNTFIDDYDIASYGIKWNVVEQKETITWAEDNNFLLENVKMWISLPTLSD